jgi:DNA-binding CsgD family transcriptional regulator/tetratricopeptide (TPR) repeat protein
LTGTTGGVAGRGAFVGRRTELDALGAAMDAARAGRPQIVLVEGEPGIGKTAFVRRFLSSIQEVVVLQASGEESETTLDYGVLDQILSRAARESGWSAPAGELAQRSAPGSFAAGAELLGMLGAVQDTAPIALVLEDAHWMDSASAGALLFALRRLHGDRVLVLLVSRPGGLAHLGPSWSRLLADADRVRPIALAGLSAPEVNELAERLGVGPLTVAAGERLREHTSGHPLYVKALLSELPPEQLNFGDGELPAPHSFAATVMARLAEIGTDAQNLVSAAAIAGPRCPLMLAAPVAGLDDPLAALEEALGAELLARAPGRMPEEITFPHPLIRAAVYDDLSPTRRRALHLACAERTSGTVALGHRVAASPGADDRLAADLQAAAEGELSAGHLPSGVQHLLWASRVADSRSIRERSLMRAVECLVLAGDTPAANSHLDALLACSDSPRRSFTLGVLSAAAGRVDEAHTTFRDVIARPDYGSDPDLRGPVTASLAISCGLLGHAEEAIGFARDVLDTPRAPATAVTTARQALGLGLLMSSRGDEAIATLEASASRIEPEPFEADLLIARGTFKAFWGDLAGAAEDHAAVIRWGRAGLPFRGIPIAYGGLAEVEYRQGRWDDGLAHIDVAIALVEDSDRVWDLPFVHAVASYLSAGRGNFSEASAHVETARRAAEATPLPMCVYYAAAAAANLAWVRAEWGEVVRALVPLQAAMRGRAVPGLGRRVVQAMGAEALLFLGQLDQAELIIAQLEGELGERPDDPSRIELLRLRGLLEQARRRPREARAAFERAREAAQEIEAPLGEGLLELARGQFLRKSASRRAAISALQAAQELFTRLGAEPFLVRCRAELAACGVRARDPEDENGFGLTAREEVVARLVASGKSNREVAEELFLSTKAIEYHLGNVFAKVNVRSRHELAGRLARAGSDGGV